ncbi:MAG: hypothetical protein QOE68_3380 [Thermoanaerobaculia bacterium]|jgi:hypothetical protein|nr:hypothetical protein [Thermoanaerobaculia bacterium]
MIDEAKAFEVSVIVFREGSTWTALALEMDIRGYGSSRKAAVDDALAMITAQVSFAVQMGHAESVWKPAEEKYRRMWENARRNQFMAEISGSEAPADEIADLVPIPLLALKHKDEWIAARA